MCEAQEKVIAVCRSDLLLIMWAVSAAMTRWVPLLGGIPNLSWDFFAVTAFPSSVGTIQLMEWGYERGVVGTNSKFIERGAEAEHPIKPTTT